MATFSWKFQIEDRGFKEVEFDNPCFIYKAEYVKNFLSPSLKAAKCGWGHARYVVMTTDSGYTEEFVILSDDEREFGARYIPVGATSLGGIAKSVWDNVFN